MILLLIEILVFLFIPWLGDKDFLLEDLRLFYTREGLNYFGFETEDNNLDLSLIMEFDLEFVCDLDLDLGFWYEFFYFNV